MTLPEIIGEKAWVTSPLCMRCPLCSNACPSGAIKLLHKDNLSRAIASAANGVLSTFEKGKTAFVSFAKDITQYCDCRSGPGAISMEDLGILASNSPVSIDAAFLNMIDYKIFNSAYDVDCWLQVQEAKELGIDGETKPKIQNIV